MIFTNSQHSYIANKRLFMFPSVILFCELLPSKETSMVWILPEFMNLLDIFHSINDMHNGPIRVQGLEISLPQTKKVVNFDSKLFSAYFSGGRY